MSLGLFVQIVILMVIGAFIFNAVRCIHDKFCAICKSKKDECCK